MSAAASSAALLPPGAVPVAPVAGTFHPHNPQHALAATFAGIAATRMAGLPVFNPALAVAVPAMRAWEGEWLGVLVTPWAVNLVLLPGEGGRFQPIEVGGTQIWHFPSGRYAFLGNREAGLGHYQSCSLLSPVFELASQDAAEAFACAALDALLRAPAEPAAGASQALSRRAFLGGSRRREEA